MLYRGGFLKTPKYENIEDYDEKGVDNEAFTR